jgi:hypothetical protein
MPTSAGQAALGRTERQSTILLSWEHLSPYKTRHSRHSPVKPLIPIMKSLSGSEISPDIEPDIGQQKPDKSSVGTRSLLCLRTGVLGRAGRVLTATRSRSRFLIVFSTVRYQSGSSITARLYLRRFFDPPCEGRTELASDIATDVTR